MQVDHLARPGVALGGANLRHVEAKLPHLNRLLARTPDEALADAEVVVVASSDPGLLAALVAATEGDAGPRQVIDLHGRLGDDVEKIAGYEGVGW